MIYKAHKKEDTGEIQTVKTHSENTSKLCESYSIETLQPLISNLGLVHDIGKYQKSFQKKIDGAPIRVEHSTCGALAIKGRYSRPVEFMMDYCIVGHHSGLPDGGNFSDSCNMPTLAGRLKRETEPFDAYKKDLTLTDFDNTPIINFIMEDCGSDAELLIDKFAFLTRYCFSCLTDADSTDTGNFHRSAETGRLRTDYAACLEKINRRLGSFVCETGLQKCRGELQKQAFEKTGIDSGVYFMNMPTGSGKTLCSMKFALERALKRGRKRIIYVIPYNSIIDQTMIEFEGLFGKDAQILRHQSTFSYEDYKKTDEDFAEAAEAATENWDVETIIITTAVQFFESIYKNKRGRLRKLHNMQDSVIIFDEVHLLPANYLQPCLRAIAYITKYLNSEAVFLTATMPDFEGLFKKYAFTGVGATDLITDKSAFPVFQKCKYANLGTQSPEEILEKSNKSPSSLIIVNRKSTARSLYRLCPGKKFHLSTYMTAFDRRRVIREIKNELRKLEMDFPALENVPKERRITVISTSLIEAGIDIDMYTVFRELSGLDSILQAGGRCNREGKRESGFVYIFENKEDAYRSSDIKRNITKNILEKYSDISAPDCVKDYYRQVYDINSGEITKNTITENCKDLSDIPFATYAKKFNMIGSDAEPIAAARDEESEKLIKSLNYCRGGVSISRKLQEYVCSVSKYELEDLHNQGAVEYSSMGLWYLTNNDYYDEETGIIFEGKDKFIL